MKPFPRWTESRWQRWSAKNPKRAELMAFSLKMAELGIPSMPVSIKAKPPTIEDQSKKTTDPLTILTWLWNDIDTVFVMERADLRADNG